MSGTITALKFEAHSQQRVSVYLDGEPAFWLPALEAARLRHGQVLSDAEIAALRALDERECAYEQAVRFLGFRPRSRAELAQYLRRKRVADEIVSDVLARLKDAGYLDDEAFARFWVENRQMFRPRSQRALGIELRQKGVSREVVHDAVSEQDDEAAAWQAVEGRLSRWSDLNPDELRPKITGFLARRGFGYSTINHTFKSACRALQIED